MEKTKRKIETNLTEYARQIWLEAKPGEIEVGDLRIVRRFTDKAIFIEANQSQRKNERTRNHSVTLNLSEDELRALAKALTNMVGDIDGMPRPCPMCGKTMTLVHESYVRILDGEHNHWLCDGCGYEEPYNPVQ